MGVKEQMKREAQEFRSDVVLLNIEACRRAVLAHIRTLKDVWRGEHVIQTKHGEPRLVGVFSFLVFEDGTMSAQSHGTMHPAAVGNTMVAVGDLILAGYTPAEIVAMPNPRESVELILKKESGDEQND